MNFRFPIWISVLESSFEIQFWISSAKLVSTYILSRVHYLAYTISRSNLPTLRTEPTLRGTPKLDTRTSRRYHIPTTRSAKKSESKPTENTANIKIAIIA